MLIKKEPNTILESFLGDSCRHSRITLFERLLRAYIQQHTRGDEFLSRSLRRFLFVLLRRLDQKQPDPGWKEHLGDIYEARTEESVGH